MNDLMSIAEAAAALGIHRATLARAAQRGTLRAIPVGGAWAVTREALEDYRQQSQGRPGRKRAGSVTAPVERPHRRIAVRSPRVSPVTEPETLGASPPPTDSPPINHRLKGREKLLYAGPGGATVQWTQNGKARRPSATDVRAWEQEGRVRWTKPTPAMADAARALNDKSKRRR